MLASFLRTYIYLVIGQGVSVVLALANSAHFGASFWLYQGLVHVAIASLILLVVHKTKRNNVVKRGY